MSSSSPHQVRSAPVPLPRAETILLLAIAASIALLHIATNTRYGFHRDEYQFLSDALHLDWGFVAYPPLTPFLEHIGLSLFGFSIVWLRMFSVLAQATAIVITGLMARELAEVSLAQFTAALAVALSPLPLFEGTQFQYSSFDYLWWVLIAYFTIRLLNSNNSRWWLAIGAVVGLGLLTKYSVVFYIAGILAGLALSRARRFLASPWFWAGIAVALLLFLPNFLWLIHHDFISYKFRIFTHATSVKAARTGFCVNNPGSASTCLPRRFVSQAWSLCSAMPAIVCWRGCSWCRLCFFTSAKVAPTTWPPHTQCCLPWVLSPLSDGSRHCQDLQGE